MTINDNYWVVLIAILVNVNCALVGSFLAFRNMAMLGDAIAHSILPGAVMAFLVTGSRGSLVSIVGACMTGMLASVLISFLEKQVKIRADAAIGIVFTSFLALGVALVSALSTKFDFDLDCSIYGELNTAPLDVLRLPSGAILGPRSFYVLAVNLLCNAIFLFSGYKYLLITTFDPEFARSIGISNKFWHTILVVIIAITAVVSFEITGAILVISMLIVPTVSTGLVFSSLKTILAYNTLFSMIAAVVGHHISYHFSGSVAPAMVTIAGFLFFVIFCYSVSKKSYARS